MEEKADGDGAGPAAAGDGSNPQAVADMELSKLEKALICAVEEGRTYTPKASDAEWKKGIQGALIRAMLLGTELRHHPGKAEDADGQKVRVTAHGIRIAAGGRGKKGEPPAEADAPLLTIKGTLDLGGLATAGGGYLPPLELNGCRFDQPVELSDARLQSLTLRNSRFSMLRAQGTKFDGSVTLSGCGPRNESGDEEERRCAVEDLARLKKPEGAGNKKAKEAGKSMDGYKFVATRAVPAGTEQGCECAACKKGGAGDDCSLCCVVDLSSAAIAGGLEISTTYLRAPPPKGEKHDPNIRLCCAANLSHVQVRDRLEIVRCTFVGGASFVSAEVEDDIWIRGGKFLAPADSYVLDFQFATVGGVLALQAAAADPENPKEKEDRIAVYPVVVIGQLTGISLNAGEIWVGEGFYYGRDQSGQGSFPSVNFAKSDVARSFKVGAYHPQHVLDPDRPTGEARIHGEICLAAANLGKNLELHGVNHDNIQGVLKPPMYPQMGLQRFIGPWEEPHLRLRAHGLKVDRGVYLSHARFKDAKPPAPCLTEDAYAAACGKGIPPAAEPSAPGTSEAADAAACRKEIPPAAVDLWKSTIGTGFRLGEGCRCTGAVRLNSCVIGREVVIACRAIGPGPADLPAGDGDRSCIPLLLDISESTIKGHLRIGRHEPRKVQAASPKASAGKEKEAITVAGSVSLESANVQGGVLLGHITFDLRKFPHAGGSEPIDDDAEAPEDPRVALDLRDCVFGSDLEVHALRWKLPPLTKGEKEQISPRPGWRMLPSPPSRRFGSIEQRSFAVIDLRRLQCGLLVDGFGDQWGLIYRLQLRLAGMRIGDVEPASHKASHSHRKSPHESRLRRARPERARLRWLSFQNEKQEIVDEPATPEHATTKGHAPWARYYCSREEDFVPQAYDAFASAYGRAGEISVAHEILIERKNLECSLRYKRLNRQWLTPLGIFKTLALVVATLFPLWQVMTRTGIAQPNPRIFDVTFIAMAISLVFAFWAQVVGIFQLGFRGLFRYGLAPDRGLLAFVICVFIGWGSVHVARNGGWKAVPDWQAELDREVLREDIALVLDVDYEPVELNSAGNQSVAAGPAGDQSPKAADSRVAGRTVFATPTPCNLDVNSLLYAVDVFIPLIDLDQERRCSVRDAPPGPNHDPYVKWRVGKAVYELLGWVVTSLVILTITGVLRRDLER